MESELRKDVLEIDSRVKLWQFGLSGLALLLTGAYFGYFYIQLGQSPAQDAEKWGQFGDFVGGLLNPVVAFAAFYWLTQSVKLQKTELAETREELRKSALAQQKQVENGNKSIQIAALTAVVSAGQVQIGALEQELAILERESKPYESQQVSRKESFKRLYSATYKRNDLIDNARLALEEVQAMCNKFNAEKKKKTKEIEALKAECANCLESLRKMVIDSAAPITDESSAPLQ